MLLVRKQSHSESSTVAWARAEKASRAETAAMLATDMILRRLFLF